MRGSARTRHKTTINSVEKLCPRYSKSVLVVRGVIHYYYIGRNFRRQIFYTIADYIIFCFQQWYSLSSIKIHLLRRVECIRLAGLQYTAREQQGHALSLLGGRLNPYPAYPNGSALLSCTVSMVIIDVTSEISMRRIRRL